MYLAEHEGNRFFATPSQSFWSMAVYLLSGFEDREPVTGPGRLLGVLFMMGGVSVVAYLTGEMASYLTLRRLGRREEGRGMDVLVVGWAHRADRLIRELVAYARTSGRAAPRITVLTGESVDETRYRGLAEYERVAFVAADPFSREVLEGLGAHEARAAVFLATGEGDADARVALGVLALRALARQRHGPEVGAIRPLIVAETRNHRTCQHVLDAGANEVITASDFHMGLLAQCVQSPATAAVYRDLLHASEDTSEVYVLDDLPPQRFRELFEGRTFAEAAAALAALDPPVVLLGVVRGGRVLTAPPREAFARFEEGDRPVVVARSRPRP